MRFYAEQKLSFYPTYRLYPIILLAYHVSAKYQYDMKDQADEEAAEVELALMEDGVEAKRKAGFLAEQYRFEQVCCHINIFC